jgi:hypothetical protein
METTELVKLSAAGNVADFSSAVQDEVLNRLRSKIEDYKCEVAASYNSSKQNDDE